MTEQFISNYHRVQTFLRSSRNVESVGNQIPTEKPAKLSASFVCLLRESYPKVRKSFIQNQIFNIIKDCYFSSSTFLNMKFSFYSCIISTISKSTSNIRCCFTINNWRRQLAWQQRKAGETWKYFPFTICSRSKSSTSLFQTKMRHL